MAYLPSKPTRSQTNNAIRDIPNISGPGLQSSGGIPFDNHRATGRLLPQIGKITNTGPLGTEADFTDYHYWVQLVENCTTATQYRQDAPLDVRNQRVSSDGVPKIITGINPGEYVAATHSFAVDTLVELLPVFFDAPQDAMAVPQLRWLIVGGGGASLPQGQYAEMVYKNKTDNQMGFDYPRSHAMT